MNEVQVPSNSERHTPSSEPCKIYIRNKNTEIEDGTKTEKNKKNNNETKRDINEERKQENRIKESFSYNNDFVIYDFAKNKV
jgi:hypothetical protein